MLISNYKNN